MLSLLKHDFQVCQLSFVYRYGRANDYWPEVALNDSTAATTGTPAAPVAPASPAAPVANATVATTTAPVATTFTKNLPAQVSCILLIIFRIPEPNLSTGLKTSASVEPAVTIKFSQFDLNCSIIPAGVCNLS
jgi:hypothetical protein